MIPESPGNYRDKVTVAQAPWSRMPAAGFLGRKGPGSPGLKSARFMRGGGAPPGWDAVRIGPKLWPFSGLNGGKLHIIYPMAAAAGKAPRAGAGRSGREPNMGGLYVSGCIFRQILSFCTEMGGETISFNKSVGSYLRFFRQNDKLTNKKHGQAQKILQLLWLFC